MSGPRRPRQPPFEARPPRPPRGASQPPAAGTAGPRPVKAAPAPRFSPAEAQAIFERLARQRALPTLLRGLPLPLLRRLLKDALPSRSARELPDEVWASLAVGLALEAPDFAPHLAQALDDQFGWDREPTVFDDWWPPVVERPLEALWNAARSASKEVRREFAHLAGHALENFRGSGDCAPPSWDYVDGVLEVHADLQRELRALERRLDEADRHLESERDRLHELREELRQLRRQNSELRAERTQAERRAAALEERQRTSGGDARRLEELERRAHRAEKERDHLWGELERAQAALAESGVVSAPPPSPPAAGPEPESEGESAPDGDLDSAGPGGEPVPRLALADDPNPRRRVLRLMLRKLIKKSKIGGAHTHEDNVYRGVADHEKGFAKEALELLAREGLLLPKPTATDPHISIDPARLAEVHAIVAGRVDNPRLQRFCEP